MERSCEYTTAVLLMRLPPPHRTSFLKHYMRIMLNQALKNKKNRIREGGVEIKPLQGSKARQKMTRK